MIFLSNVCSWIQVIMVSNAKQCLGCFQIDLSPHCSIIGTGDDEKAGYGRSRHPQIR